MCIIILCCLSQDKLEGWFEMRLSIASILVELICKSDAVRIPYPTFVARYYVSKASWHQRVNPNGVQVGVGP